MPYYQQYSYNFALKNIFDDSLIIPCYYDDNYDRSIVEQLDRLTKEGPYGYQDGNFDVSVHKDDVVIDAGAWAGDFGAYCSSKGALTYCFEPLSANYKILCETARLNHHRIVPVQKALGSHEGTAFFESADELDTAGKVSLAVNKGEKVQITTVDSFVRDHQLERVDFIKSDIEGAERDMLRGARETLRRFAPKLAICTYHLPDDPEVLAGIIKEANPNYRIVQMRHKLFAAVVNE